MPTSDLAPWQRQILASGRWFCGLPASLQQALCDQARVVTVPTGKLLFQRGDAGDGLYAVLEGAIRLGAVNPEGKESVVGLAQPPQWFGEVALLDNQARTHDAWAEFDATLAHVPLAAITGWLAQHPAHWRCMGQLTVHKLRVMFATIEDSGLHTPRERLIRCLVLLAGAYGQRDAMSVPAPALRVSQERLGSMLSLSRQTVNALLQELEREKLVMVIRGGVRIVDFMRLLQLEASIR